MSSSPLDLGFAERLAASKAGAWTIINILGRVDPWLLKKTNGRFSMLVGKPVLVLKHIGARTGTKRETALQYAADGDSIFIIASNGGSERHPSWYYNLKANPSCGVVAKNRSGEYAAVELTGDTYEEAWAKMVALFGGYSVYQDRTGGRHIPIMGLDPA